MENRRLVTQTRVPDLADTLNREAHAARYVVRARIRKVEGPKDGGLPGRDQGQRASHRIDGVRGFGRFGRGTKKGVKPHFHIF